MKNTYPALIALDNPKLEALRQGWKAVLETCRQAGLPDDQLFDLLARGPGDPARLQDPTRGLGTILASLKEAPIPVREGAEKTSLALREATLAEQARGPGMEGWQGPSLWAPTNAADLIHDLRLYHQEASETGWSEYLVEALNRVPREKSVPYSQIAVSLEKLRRQLHTESVPPIEQEGLVRQVAELEASLARMRPALQLSTPAHDKTSG